MSTASIYDYESIEEYLGNRLRAADNLDYHSDEFFPVSLLDMLFHFSEKLSIVENRHDKGSFKNFHGHDFDRWIDNLVASATLAIEDDENEASEIKLIDIDCIRIVPDGDTTVMLPDETVYNIINITDGISRQKVSINSIQQLDISLELKNIISQTANNEEDEAYQAFGSLAHVVRVVCEKNSINPCDIDCRRLSEKIFEIFKFELLPLIPSLWNDMEIIYDTVTPILTYCSKLC